MKLHELKKVAGATKNRKRVGRGPGSGSGKTAGRGQDGQNSRSGGGVSAVFEGGQLPLFRRIPKRGFNNYNFMTRYAILNVVDLNDFDEGTVVTIELLKEKNIIKKELSGLKILGDGELTKKMTVKAKKFSNTAKKKIEAAGGKIEVI